MGHYERPTKYTYFVGGYFIFIQIKTWSDNNDYVNFGYVVFISRLICV